MPPKPNKRLCHDTCHNIDNNLIDMVVLQLTATSMNAYTYTIFCMGNALLDMQVTNGQELLGKYGLKANDAILAEEKHSAM
jgi:hypothetical protein